jgi:hypothetical protein
MINARSKKNKHILRALRKGRHYAVSGHKGMMANNLESLEIKGNRLIVTCESPANQIRFIGQGGKLKKKVELSATAEYRLQMNDTYIRTEIFSNGCEFFLNPVIRWNRKSLSDFKAIPDKDWFATWIQRVILLLVIVFSGMIIYIFHQQKNMEKKEN